MDFYGFYFLKLYNIPAKLFRDLHFQKHSWLDINFPSLFLLRDSFLKRFELLSFTILQWGKRILRGIKVFSLISSTWILFLTSPLWWRCHRRGAPPHHSINIIGSAAYQKYVVSFQSKKNQHCIYQNSSAVLLNAILWQKSPDPWISRGTTVSLTKSFLCLLLSPQRSPSINHPSSSPPHSGVTIVELWQHNVCFCYQCEVKCSHLSPR